MTTVVTTHAGWL